MPRPLGRRDKKGRGEWGTQAGAGQPPTGWLCGFRGSACQLPAVRHGRGTRLFWDKLGLCDMHGNVWQWTDTAEGQARVSRGGSWNFRGTNCQAADRYKHSPAHRTVNIGFRLVRVPVR